MSTEDSESEYRTVQIVRALETPSRYGQSTTPDPLIGAIVGGKYLILDVIGRGGMSTVYRARETGIVERQVAIKLLLPELRQSAKARVLQEARIIGTIQHPNVIQLLDAGIIEPDTIYIAMELLHGRTLLDILREMEARGEVFAWDRLAPMMLQICEGLRAAHQLGFVHRDMKPGNCFCLDLGDGRWHMKVLDFGISKVQEVLHEASAEGPLTSDGVFVGTPHYAAPEAIRDGFTIDHRADIYAIGVMLYQCVSGSLPFAGTDRVEALYRAAHERPAPPSARRPDADIPAAVDALIMRALAIDPGDRYASIVELIDAIRRVDPGAAPATLTLAADPRTTAAAAGSARRTLDVPTLLPALVTPRPAERRFSGLLAFAADSARSLLGFLTRRMWARKRRTRIGFWRANDPGASGTYGATDGPWLDIDALLSRHDFECTHEEARQIATFLGESFHRFRMVGKQTLELDFEGSAVRASTVRWRHYCIIVTSEFAAPAGRLGATTFVERLINIEPLLHAIRRNARKTVIVVTKSDRIGRGIFEKIQRYRSEFDIYVIPILVSDIVRAQRHRAGAQQSHLIREFNRLHPAECRLAVDGPLTESAEVAGFSEMIDRGSSHLARSGPSVLIVSGMPMSGKTSVIYAICGELGLGAPAVESLHARRTESKGSTAPPRSEGPRVVVLDNILPQDMFSARLAEWLAPHLGAGRKVVLTSVRLPTQWIEFLQTVAPPGTEIDAVATRPLGDAKFLDYLWMQCVRRNIRLNQRTIELLSRLSGGLVGFATAILDQTMRSVLATPSPRRTLADMIDVLRPIEIGPAELRNGAAALVTRTRLFLSLSIHFTAAERTLMKALALGPVSASKLTALLSDELSPPEIHTALLGLCALHLIDSQSRAWGDVQYSLTIGAFRYWIDMVAQGQSGWPAEPPTGQAAIRSIAGPTEAPPRREERRDSGTVADDPSDLDQVRTAEIQRENTSDRTVRASDRTALSDLLTSLFNDEELRAFLGDLEGGTSLLGRLPSQQVPFLSLIKQTVDIMMRHGYIDSAFFQALKAVFHRRRADIDGVARLWGFGEKMPTRGQGGTIFAERIGPGVEDGIVFVSYSQDDWSEVQKLAGNLHRVGLRPILDAWERDGGQSRGRLGSDLRRSLPGIVVLSPRSAANGWLVGLLTSSAPASPRTVVPLLIGGVSPPAFIGPDRCVHVADIEDCEADLRHLAKMLRRTMR